MKAEIVEDERWNLKLRISAENIAESIALREWQKYESGREPIQNRIMIDEYAFREKK